MNIHQLQGMTFEEALDLLEERLIEVQKTIDATQKKIDDGDFDGDEQKVRARFDEVLKDRAELEKKMEKLRELRASELAGENDNLLTESLALFDQIGERIEKVLGLKD